MLLAPTTIDVVSYCAFRCWFRVIVARPGINPFSVPEFLPCLADLPDWEAVIVRASPHSTHLVLGGFCLQGLNDNSPAVFLSASINMPNITLLSEVQLNATPISRRRDWVQTNHASTFRLFRSPQTMRLRFG